MGGLPLCPASAMLLYDGRGEAWLPTAGVVLLTAPCSSALAAWLLQKSVRRSSHEHFPCTSAARPAHRQPEGVKAEKWPPSVATRTPALKAIAFRGERARRSIVYHSDPFLPNKHPQSSFCIAACVTELAHLPLLGQRQHPSVPASPLHGTIVFGDHFHVSLNKYSLSFPC